MPRTRKPRAGSMQFWPRVRSRFSYPRIRNWPASAEARLLGFAGYKVGMTHVLMQDTNPNSLTKGQEIFCPTTVVECPPLKTASIRFYKKSQNGVKLVSELTADSLDKELERKILIAKKSKGKEPDDFDFIRVLCYTQPKLTGFGKKKPDVFEIAVGGNKEQQIAYVRERLGKEIHVNDVFRDGQQTDAHSITKGRGFRGPIRRFGIQLRHHKSEKSRRNPGSLGAWRAQGHIMWRVAHAGKTGYNLRTEYNKQILKIGSKADEINVRGGFLHYGNVQGSYMLIKGSVGGHQKTLIRFSDPMRPKKTHAVSELTYISKESKQGR